MAATVPLAPGNEIFAAFPEHTCAHCHAGIMPGERWVRVKVYEAMSAGATRYRRYHADLFGEEVLSCWEKHQMETEKAERAA